MSFLAPLYLLAGLAIAAPVIFHLVRRAPRRRMTFSSTMFLAQTPPPATRRSRIEDWLLLLLRAFALCLLAFCFARPYLRAEQTQPGRAAGRHWGVLLDVSASMQRPGFWTEAKAACLDAGERMSPEDRLHVWTFADELDLVGGPDDWNMSTPPARRAQLEERLNAIAPGWRGTQLAQAMWSAAEELGRVEHSTPSTKTLLVISDLTEGSRWRPLSERPWPDDVSVRYIRVGVAAPPTNAVAQLIRDENNIATDSLRIRVTNDADSERSLFELRWRSINGDPAPATLSPVQAVVAPGRSRVIRMPRPENLECGELLLSGDDVEFDNVLYLAKPTPAPAQVVYRIDDADDSPNASLRFFLNALFTSIQQPAVELLEWPANTDEWPAGAGERRLVVVGGGLTSGQQAAVRSWLQSGGQALYVARDESQAAELYSLLELPGADVTAFTGPGYRLPARVRYEHPLLQAFNDPRFADFSKLRIWRQRRYAPDSLPQLDALISADDRSVILGEIPVGSGRLLLLTTGWNRDDSELAVWSKFAPLMLRLLERDRDGQSGSYLVGESIPRTEKVARAEAGAPAQWGVFDRPGLFRHVAQTSDDIAGGEELWVAVNLDPEESRTEAVPLDALAATGAGASPVSSPVPAAVGDRQLLSRELESRQQLWKWILAAAFCVVLMETVGSGWRVWRVGRTATA